MDIYSFIRSKDVATHCRNIGKTWNTCEMATMIDRSNHTIADKHTAWQKLIEQYPDMSAIMPNYHKVCFDSVHKKIAERIDYDQQAIKWFKTPENGALYTYGSHTWGAGNFTTFEKALTDLTESWFNKRKELNPYFEKAIDTDLIFGWSQNGVPYIYFEKKFPDLEVGGGAALCDCDGNLYKLWVWVEDEVYAKWFPHVTKNQKTMVGLYEFEFADLFFIDIPIPFKRGDLLTCAGHKKTEVFVLDGCNIFDNPKQYARCLRGEIGDGSDLDGWGFFVNDAGVLYGDHTKDYDSFEYYNGELVGKDRLLHYVSLFISDKIRLPEFLTMQNRLIAEHLLNSNFRFDEHSGCIPEHLLCENRHKVK